MANVNINTDNCVGCGECADNCPASILEVVDGKVTVTDDDSCLTCETCVSVCEHDAISINS
ncbi:MAG: 4Fe-4S binding protein [Clostridia bacterium]|nr:4Fe-4S binding protein [Clostridia bacterium]